METVGMLGAGSRPRRAAARLAATLLLAGAIGLAASPAALAQDTTPPITTATLDPAEPGPGGTYDGPVGVTLRGDDGPGGSGVARTEYRIDGGEWRSTEEAIFDGTATSLARWAQAPGGSFALQPDGSIQSTGGLGMLWYPVKAYGDFSLKLRWRDARTDAGFSNSGVFVRFPDPRIPLAQRPPGSCGTVGNAQTSQAWVAIYCGQEIQIYDGPTGETQKTGSIYNFDPLTLEEARPTPKGEWNDYEIRVVGQRYTIVRNGVVINEFDNAVPKASSRPGDPPTQARQFAAGHIGLQNHGTSDLVQIRDVRVQEPVRVSAPGAHTVEYRSIDVAGNVEAAKSVSFTIREPLQPCGTDEFAGTALDDRRWDVLRPAGSGLAVADGKLSLELRSGDLITGTASAQNVVLQDAPAGGWTATTKLNIGAIDANGEQAGMALWKSESPNTFGKITFIQSGDGTRRFEAIFTDGGSLAVPLPPVSSTPAPGGLPANADVLLRLRSDGRLVVAQFSADDGATWTAIGQPAVVPGSVRVGLLAIRGATGGGTVPFERFDLSCGPQATVAASAARGKAPLTVNFTGTVDEPGAQLRWDFGDGTTATGGATRSHTFQQPGAYRVTLAATDADGNVGVGSTTVTVLADDPPCPAGSDEFGGNALDPKWEILRPLPTGLDVSDGALRLRAYGGDMHSGNATARNVLLQPAPTGGWTATTKIDVRGLTVTGDQVGLVVWRSEAPNHFAKIVFNKRGGGYWVERANTVNGVASGERTDELAQVPETIHLRARAGASIAAEYSLDGEAWTAVGAPFLLGGTGPLKVGLTYFQGVALRTAAFDWFRLDGPEPCAGEDETPPTTTPTLDPAEPSGRAGWYTGPVQVTLAAADEPEGSGVARTEYRVDGGAFGPYDGPFAVADDGRHTIEYRSVDTAGNEEAAGSRTVNVDATAPSTEAVVDAGTVTLAAADGDGSGVESTSYRVDGGEWRAYASPVSVSAPGEHTVEYRSVDVAGNVEEAGRATVAIDEAPRPTPAPSPEPAPRSAPPASEPSPWVRLDRPRTSLAAFLRRGLRVTGRCVGVDRGVATASVSRRMARRLRLAGTSLAGGDLRCDRYGRISAVLKADAELRRQLRRARGAVRVTLTVRMGAASSRLGVTLRAASTFAPPPRKRSLTLGQNRHRLGSQASKG